MSSKDNKSVLKSIRQRNYLARDFDGFRSVLLDYARTYYPDRIQDFSESSVGGLFLDMAAYIGDNMSFYLDHLYGELNTETVIETNNIERALNNAGVPIQGSSSAVATVDFFIEIPILQDESLTPNPSLIPTIKSETTIQSDNGTIFTLLEDVKFWNSDPKTGLITIDPKVEVFNGRRILGNIVSKILKKSGTCCSGVQTVENFSIGSFVKFRKLTLSQQNVTQIISVKDGFGNVYYEVDSLSNDVVYRNVLNTSPYDSLLVKDSLKIIPAPYRFIKNTSLSDRSCTLTFGGGSSDSLEDDIIPDPSEFALSLPYSQTFSKISINPQKMLKTSTLGVAAENTILTVTYRYGGGLSHNVPANTIKNITNLIVEFPENPTPGEQSQVKNTIEASNPSPAAGGEDALTSDELLALIPTVKNSQERIVTKEDLLSRVYTMPSNFGRVFRAMVTKNPDNPLSSRLYIISRDANSNLIISPDTLKINLKRYLNSYRMVSDAIDVMDASIINLELNFSIVADPSFNKQVLLQSIISDLKNQFNITNFHIGQPIIISDIVATIFARNGVISVDSIQFKNLNGTVKNKEYSPISFNIEQNKKNQILYPGDGAIFEIKYPDINIIGKCVTNV